MRKRHEPRGLHKPIREIFIAGFAGLAIAGFVASADPVSAGFEGGDSDTSYGTPTSTTKVESRINQLKSSAGNPYTLIQYEVPTKNAVPHILAIGKNDEIWFSESGGQFAKNFLDVPPQNKVGRLDKYGTISEWVLSESPTSPMGVVFDQKSDLWIAERLGNRITRLRKNGGMDYFDIPTSGAWPTGIAVDSKGKIWFSETKGDKLGVVDPQAGKITEYPLPVKGAMATGIAVDELDNVWLAERDANVIGKFDSRNEKFTQYALPTENAKPCNVLPDGAGGVWFTERNGGKLGRIDKHGAIQEYTVPDKFGGPFILAADRLGDIWFTQIFGNEIGRFNPKNRSFETFDIPGEKSYPAGIAVDSKGNIWFAEQASNKLSMIVRSNLAYLVGEETGRPGSLLAPSDSFTILEMDVPTAQSIPGIVTVDRNGTVWFTEMGGGFVSPGFPPGSAGSKIGYIRDGVIKELKTPTPESGPTSMSLDPCSDDVWVTLRAGNKIARIRNFEITEFEIPIQNSMPIGISVDYDHNVWVALSEANKIARRSPEGNWSFIDIPEREAQPRTVFVDRSNEVWFAEKTGNHIGWVDKKNWSLKRWQIPTKLAWPLSLEEDNDGNLWFAEMRSDKLGVINRKTREIVEYNLPVQSAPFKINYDQTRNCFWISTVFGNAIMRFDLEKKRVVAVYKAPSEGAWIGGLARDKDDCIWFSEQFANKIGKLCIDGVSRQK